jgi:hypothetical protein
VADTTNYAVGAKGDLLAGTAADTVAALAVGNNGETLVADSSTSTGLRWQGDYAAGKNKIINGDFTINQRAFTSNTTSGAFNFDRWAQFNAGGTFTVTPQTFTPGTAPVSGYESANFLRGVTASQSAVSDFASLIQRIEDVRTFAGQTVTVSFWAKADTGTPAISIEALQSFGTGGSPSAAVTGSVAAGTVAKKTISTSWARYSATLTIPSISGKTIGTTVNTSYLSLSLFVSAGSDRATRTDSLGIQNGTFDIWGVQIEAGSVATAFQTATGTIQGELAACQRYYAKSYSQATAPATNSSANGLVFAQSGATAASSAYIYTVNYPVVMRQNPTVTIYSFTSSQTARISDGAGTDLAAASGAVNLNNEARFTVQNNSGGALTAAQGGFVFHYTASAEL